MTTEGAILGGLAKQQLGLIIGIGVGAALSAALEPEVVSIRQAQYAGRPEVAVEPSDAARIVAEAVELAEWGRKEAAQFGIDSQRFDALVGEALNAPGLGELLRMIRRGAIEPADFTHGLRKLKLEERWDDAAAELEHERLEPAAVAVMIQRGVLEDPGLLPVGPPTEAGLVPPMPVADVDAIAEAKAHGVDRERLAAMTRIVGLPPAPGELLQLLNRGHIEEVDYFRGIAEGNTRNEWASFLLELRQRILTPHEYAELRVRGWIKDEQMYAGTALSGLSHDDTHLLFNLLGRPIPIHQVTTGLARGGEYDGDASHIPESYLRSLQEGNLRPEWYSLAYANRYNFPGAFVLRALTQHGDLSEKESRDILLFEGWEPTLAAKVAGRWAEPVGAKADPHVSKAQTQLWTALHKAYVLGEAAPPALGEDLAAVGVGDAAQVKVRALWDRERELVRATLSAKEIKKAVGEHLMTEAEGLERLQALGYSPADARLELEL